MSRAPNELYKRIQSEEVEILVNAFQQYPLAQMHSLIRNAADQFWRTRSTYAIVRQEELNEQGRRQGVERELQPLRPYLSHISLTHTVSFSVAFIVLVFLAAFPRTYACQRREIAILVIALLCNAAIFGGLSVPDDRYQARLTWIALLMALLLVLDRRRHQSLSR